MTEKTENQRIVESINRLSEQFESFNENLTNLNAALYDNEENRQKGLITIVHEMKPKVDTFSNYLQARDELRKAYFNTIKWVGAVLTIAGTIVTIIVALR